MRIHIIIENISIERTVSQIFNLGPSSDFMNSQKIIMQK